MRHLLHVCSLYSLLVSCLTGFISVLMCDCMFLALQVIQLCVFIFQSWLLALLFLLLFQVTISSTYVFLYKYALKSVILTTAYFILLLQLALLPTY